MVCADLDEDDAVINSKITAIRAMFIEKYGEIIRKGTWTGNRAIFADFERVIDDTILGAIKVSIIGDPGVGKTTLVHLICGEEIDLEYVPTINADITSFDGEDLGIHRSLVFWDLAGQKSYRSLWKSLLDSTDIALLVLDSSFENVNHSKEIMRDVLDKYYKNIVVIGIANKQDLPNRLTPEFCQRILSEAERNPPIKVYGMIAINSDYKEAIFAILRDAIAKIYK